LHTATVPADLSRGSSLATKAPINHVHYSYHPLQYGRFRGYPGLGPSPTWDTLECQVLSLPASGSGAEKDLGRYVPAVVLPYISFNKYSVNLHTHDTIMHPTMPPQHPGLSLKPVITNRTGYRLFDRIQCELSPQLQVTRST